MKSSIILFGFLLAGLASAQTVPRECHGCGAPGLIGSNVALSDWREECFASRPTLWFTTLCWYLRRCLASDDAGKKPGTNWDLGVFKDSLNGALGGVIVHEIEESG